MKTQSVSIGNLQIKSNTMLAPMAGYTDYAFRKLCLLEGASLCFTELVSAKGLYYGGEGSLELLTTKETTRDTAVQIFGSDEYFMRWACESDALKDFNIVDINMGCPVPKVFKNGEGSALLLNLKKAQNIVSECVKSGKIITVKIRTGQKYGDDIAQDFCKGLEDAGAKMITVHGRVREAYYSGEPDYNAIYKAKKAVKIPIIANGGIFTISDADKMMNETGADGVMLARGAVANPFLFAQLNGRAPTKTLKEFMIAHLNEMGVLYGEENGTERWRKFVPYYFKGIPDIKKVKLQLLSSKTVKESVEIIKNLSI